MFIDKKEDLNCDRVTAPAAEGGHKSEIRDHD